MAKTSGEFEVVGLDAVHLAHVEVVALGVEGVGIEGLAEEAGGAALADDVGFLERTRQHHERQHRLSTGLRRMMLEPKFGKSFALGGSSWPDGLTLSVV
jgi:hypothetical protein